MWPLAGAGLLVGAICSATAASVNRHGNNDYASGDYDGAISQYRTAEAMAPSQGELYHNAGNAFDRQGEYDKASRRDAARVTGAPGAVSRLEYALGNHYVGSSKLSDALEAYKRALLADPADADAKHNLEVVTARLTPSPTARRAAADASSRTRRSSRARRRKRDRRAARPRRRRAPGREPATRGWRRASWSARSRMRWRGRTGSSRRTKRSACLNCWTKRTGAPSSG